MKLKHFSLIFAITGTLFLYYLSTLIEPMISYLIEISNFEGKQITTKGVVSEYYTAKYGSHMITIKNNNTSAVVFLESEIELEYGDFIQVTGLLQKYKENRERKKRQRQREKEKKLREGIKRKRGLLVLLISTFIGLLPVEFGVRRSHCMGVLLIPIIFYFI